MGRKAPEGLRLSQGSMLVKHERTKRHVKSLGAQAQPPLAVASQAQEHARRPVRVDERHCGFELGQEVSG